MKECHICQQYYKKGFKAQCSKSSCRLIYCTDCIKQYFDEIFKESQYEHNKWICFSCKKICKCKICLGIGVLALQNMMIKKLKESQAGKSPQKRQIQVESKKSNENIVQTQKQQKKIVSPMKKMFLRYNYLYQKEKEIMKGVIQQGQPKHDGSMIKQLKSNKKQQKNQDIIILE